MADQNVMGLLLGGANVAVGTALFWATWQYTKAARSQATAALQQADAARDQAESGIRQAETARAQMEALSQQVAIMRPRPYVYLSLGWRWDTLSLENTGNRVAKDVRIEVHQDAHAFLSDFRPARRAVAGLPPGGAVRQTMGNRLVRYDASPEDLLDFTVSYEDADGEAYSERSQLRLADMFEFMTGSPPKGMSQEQMDAGRRHLEIVNALGQISNALARSERPV